MLDKKQIQCSLFLESEKCDKPDSCIEYDCVLLPVVANADLQCTSSTRNLQASLKGLPWLSPSALF